MGRELELASRLLPPFAAWLESHGDARGEFVRVHLAVDRYCWDGADQPPEQELAFLREIVTRPTDEQAILVFADWLEDRGDSRFGGVRLVARRRALGRELDPWWVEDFFPRGTNVGLGPADEATRHVIRLADREAKSLNHWFVSTQHVLLAFQREDFGLATTTLKELGLPRAAIGREVERLTPSGTEDIVLLGKLPSSACLRAANRYTFQESLGGEVAQPEHLLLGLCRAAPCAATRVLVNLGVMPALVCERLLKGMGQDPWPWLRARPEVW